VTPDEVVDLAIGYASRYTDDIPTARAVLYRRISTRQRELFIYVASIDPEVYGEEILAELVDGALDIGALEQSDDVYPVERIDQVLVEDPGANVLRVAGEEITIVRAGDPSVSVPPRATYRSQVLRQVGSDLVGINTVRVYYSRRPRPIGLDGSGTIEFLEPFQELLVYDLAKEIILRADDMEGGPHSREAVMDKMEEAEEKMFDSLTQHISNLAAARTDRFSRA
jgi:hypothetical protein